MKVKVAWLNQIQGFLLAWIWWVWPNPSIFREMFSNPSIFEEIHILTLKNSRIWYFLSYFHATFTYRNASAQIFDQFDTLDHTVRWRSNSSKAPSRSTRCLSSLVHATLHKYWTRTLSNYSDYKILTLHAGQKVFKLVTIQILV